MYLLAINQALSYGCSFVTYGHPEGSAAGDITIILYIYKSESREMPSKKGRDVFYATGFVVSRPLLKLDVIKNVHATVFILNRYL